jgi:enamine deaminase RidA (YjgF/YER057c/UK114 family)
MATARDRVALAPRRADRKMHTSHGEITLRRVDGPTARELFVVGRPVASSVGAALQTEEIYASIFEALVGQGMGPEALLAETIFLRRIQDDLDLVLDGRRRAFARAGIREPQPIVTLIGQAPLEPGQGGLEVAATARIARTPESASASDFTRSLSCSCAACSDGARARVLRIGEESHFRTTNVHGAGRDVFEQATDMFRVANDLLNEAGMAFGDVIRTWIYLRDIDRDYDALNRARREFFRRTGVERRPVSTGIQGIPCAAAHDVSLSLHAITSSRPLDVAVISSPTLNEAWTYGAEFSRGLKVFDANKVTLHVSGTASIDEAGRTVHAGDLEAQADRMLHNIASLLSTERASFRNVVSAVTYLKNPSDAPAVGRLLRDRGFDGFPLSVVHGPLCRPELLCETEAVAVLPRQETAGRSRCES